MNSKLDQLQIIQSAKRKSIAIQVYPDCSVRVRVPAWLSQEKIAEVIQQKGDWIAKKVAYFLQNQRAIARPKEYINGESFYYLGKQYNLKIVAGYRASVAISGDMILLCKTHPHLNIKNILDKWFLEQARLLFSERLKVNFELFSKHYKYDFPTLKLRKMKSRWGSMSTQGTMTLNSSLIHTPIECIDYVIIHELCHLVHQNHGKRFHQLQAKLNPHYQVIKGKLNEFASEIRLL